MSIRTEHGRSPGHTIYQLIEEAEYADMRLRRSEARYPFFRPASIQVDEQQYSAFTREISASGIGLLHNFKLKPGEFQISILSEQEYRVRVEVEILWCRACGEGWHISGGRFTP